MRSIDCLKTLPLVAALCAPLASSAAEDATVIPPRPAPAIVDDASGSAQPVAHQTLAQIPAPAPTAGPPVSSQFAPGVGAAPLPSYGPTPGYGSAPVYGSAPAYPPGSYSSPYYGGYRGGVSNGAPAGQAHYGTPGGYEARIGSPYHYYDPAGGQYVVTGNPYYDHFGPGFHRQSLHGHYRFPYYNYRAPWYYPGRAVYQRDTNFAW